MRGVNRFNPGPGIADFWSEFTKPNPYRWPILGLSLMMTGTLLYWITQERVYLPPERPEISYITSFEPGRSDAEIVASNEANQRRKDELAAQQAEIDERKKELYRALGRATGIDVDGIEREIAEEQAAEQAEIERRLSERQVQQAAQEIPAEGETGGASAGSGTSGDPSAR